MSPPTQPSLLNTMFTKLRPDLAQLSLQPELKLTEPPDLPNKEDDVRKPNVRRITS